MSLKSRMKSEPVATLLCIWLVATLMFIIIMSVVGVVMIDQTLDPGTSTRAPHYLDRFFDTGLRVLLLPMLAMLWPIGVIERAFGTAAVLLAFLLTLAVVAIHKQREGRR